MDNNSISKPSGMSDNFYNRCLSITSKRPRTVIMHILKYGFITTEDLSDLYGYDHPPRAIRDVRENGIPLITSKVKSSKTGRLIGAYRFGDESDVIAGRIGGRKAFSKKFKDELIMHYGEMSTLNKEKIDARYLQIDHRIPYEISGNTSDEDVRDYMLLDASDQRAKSWSCENCDNFKIERDPLICAECFWAYPENYTHVAMVPQRRMYMVWSGTEVSAHDRLVQSAKDNNMTTQSLIKRILASYLKGQ